MQDSLKKYVILATILALIWGAVLAYAYVNFTAQSDVVAQEIQKSSRYAGQQVDQIFQWFEEKKEVFVTGQPDAGTPTASANTSIDGKKLTLAVPVVLAKKLENEFSNGMDIRFVGNSPLNSENLPTADDNTAMMLMAEQGRQEQFTYISARDKYHYVRPLFAEYSCLSCHITAVEGALLGAVVVETNPVKFVLSQREQRGYLFEMSLAISVVTLILLYLFIVRLWHKYRGQNNALAHSKSLVDTMSHEMEMMRNNVGRIIQGLSQDGSNPHRAELVLALQSVSQQLQSSTTHLLGADGAEMPSYEEIFHVDTFFQQCMQMFQDICQEKGVQLKLEVDNGVPSYVLGDAFHLRQMVMRILKESAMHTVAGQVCVRVQAASNMATRFNSKDLEHAPIHLLVEIEDSSTGYMVSEQNKILQDVVQKAGGSKFATRPFISMQPIMDIAEKLNGSITVASNKPTGACFKMVAQVKLVSDEAVRTSITEESKVMDMPVLATPLEVHLGAQAARAGLEEAREGVREASAGLEQMGTQMENTPAAQKTRQGLAQAQRGLNTADSGLNTMAKGMQEGRQSGGKATRAVPQTGAKASPEATVESMRLPEEQVVPLDAAAAKALIAPMEDIESISILIGDSGIEDFEDRAKAHFAEQNITAQLARSADDLFHALDSHRHEFSVVFLRELKDMDVLYAATRLRYLEKKGAKSVAIVIIAEDIVQADMNVLRFFNISTVDKFPRDANIAAKVTRMALRTHGKQIFQSGQLYNVTDMEKGQSNMLFDPERAMENSKKDEKLLRNMCAMWVRFYPEQIRRLQRVIRDGNLADILRIIGSVKNSAGTVCLPLLWNEAHRLEKMLENNEDVRFEKLLSVYEQTYAHLQQFIKEE